MIAAYLDPAPGHRSPPESIAQQLECDSRRRAVWAIAAGQLLAQLVDRAQVRDWQPGRSASGRLALVNGQIHNAADLAARLAVDPLDPASLYAAAVDRWGHQADDHVIGHYCTISLLPSEPALRLSRSPFDAPPLHFRNRDGALVAASLPRCLFAGHDSPPPPDLRKLGLMTYAGFGEDLRGWYEGCGRVPLGAVVELSREGASVRWRYDLFARPSVRFKRDEDYVEAARALLDEGVAAALGGSRKPAILLSGGLDSGSVAASVMVQQPGLPLEGFTYGPEEDWDEAVWDGMFADELTPVRRFAQMYPALRTHSCPSRFLDFRHGQRDLMRVMGCAPPSLALAWKLHEPLAQAADLGCDVMLGGDFGNDGFSATGSWGYPEYLLSGRWGQLWQALRDNPADTRPMWRRLASLAVAPLLPRPVWNRAMGWWHGGLADPVSDSGMRRDWVTGNAIDRAAAAAGFDGQRFGAASQTEWWRQVLLRDRDDIPETYQGLHQLHGVPLRDPTAYRPLLEFCYGLPTDQFLRDGIDRRLARRMAEGRLPEEQRRETRHGAHDADWHRRIGRIRGELIEELDRMADDPDIAAFVDLDAIRASLEDFPATNSIDPAACQPYVSALAFGMTAGRYIAFAKGRNDI